jgi:hypothetical protein
MQLPLVAPAPVVTNHADAFRDLFENRCQFQHFQHYLTGLMVLSNKSLTNIARCVLSSADKTNLSRFLAEAPWIAAQVNQRRIRYVLQQTKGLRCPKAESTLVFDDTLCEHVGSLFDYVDHHYNHSDGSYPLAHNPVTSFYVSGDVRFPLDLRLYRRYEELTQWETFVTKHFPEQAIPTHKKARACIKRSIHVAHRLELRPLRSFAPKSRWQSSCWKQRYGKSPRRGGVRWVVSGRGTDGAPAAQSLVSILKKNRI